MDVILLREADAEWLALTRTERVSMAKAIEKLELLGDHLPFPHSSSVQGAKGLRELRPRGGKSPWRAFYRRVGESLVIAAIGPEAQSNPRVFKRTVAVAGDRLSMWEGERN